MSKISRNIAHLRRLKKFSQEQLADELGIKKSRLGAYEESRSEPPLDLLIRISDYFALPVDILLKKDLSKAETIPSIDIGNQRILFPVSVDHSNRSLIEIVNLKASAGYLNGYGDPEFIGFLPKMQLPFAKNGTFRAFPIHGDSMPPLKNGAMVVGRFLEDITGIKDGKTYILLTRNEGIIYKRIYRDQKNKHHLLLHSDNSFYRPLAIHYKDILEIWSFVCSISTEEFEQESNDTKNMMALLFDIKKEIGIVKRRQTDQEQDNGNPTKKE